MFSDRKNVKIGAPSYIFNFLCLTKHYLKNIFYEVNKTYHNIVKN